jgi:hypothetical protein
METKLARQLGSHNKNVRVQCETTIIIPRDPEPAAETPLPDDGNAWQGFILIGGTIAAFLFWLAPEQMEAFWRNFIQQILQFAQSP